MHFTASSLYFTLHSLIYRHGWRRSQMRHLDAFKVDLEIKHEKTSTFTAEFDDRKQESVVIHCNAKHIPSAREEIERSSQYSPKK